jgi:thioredoxin-like negative regulator of GroEL|tara:strand:+ start:495 stop:875 length:381 start_codon:yes stop_codon:yes gene_type:complete
VKWLLLLSLAFGQPAKQEVNDANFYGAIYKGMHLVRFTSEWSADNKENFYQGKFIVDGDSAYYGTIVTILPSKNVPDTIRKLRIRNFPSVVLFKNGKKVKVWKADFDGNLELTTDDVKKAIDWHSR